MIKQAKWISDPLFISLSPIDIFCKENAKNNQKRPEHQKELQNRHMLVRKAFLLKEKLSEAVINITADDYYKLYVNGRFVGQGPAPSYHFHYNINEYDISGFLNEGENVIAVHIYYQGLINRVWNSGDYRMGMIAEIKCGESIVLATDETWKFHIAQEFSGERRYGYETQFAEDIDNRKKAEGWREPEFDDSLWEYAGVKENAGYTFIPQITPGVQSYTVSPDNVREVERGNIIVDFGREIAGRLLVSASGCQGQEIEIHYGEEMESGDKVRSNMRCNCKYIEKWILAGGGKTDALETYDYKAFRYVQILYGSADVDKNSIAAEVRHYPFDDSACEFKSSHLLLNKVWEICKNGVKYGTQEGYLDCLTREKGQYLGDATVTAQAHAYLTGDYRLFKKALTDFALSAFICPGLMAVAPGNFMQEIADYSLQYPLQLLKYYHLSGDIDFLKEMLPTVCGIIDYFKKFTRRDGLIENYSDKPVMVDWPNNLRDGYDYKLMPDYQDGSNAVLNAYYIGAIKTMNEIKAILNEPCDRDTENLTQAFIKVFYDEESGLFKDSDTSSHSSLHANVLPLFYGLSPDGNKIVNHIKQKRLSCGVYFSYFVLKALAEAGEYEFIYELLTCEDKQSWGNMVREGASACFEAWGADQKWNTSLLHPWAASPVIILIEDIAGVKISAGNKIDFTPHFPETLETAEIIIPTPGKRIRVTWDGHKAEME